MIRVRYIDQLSAGLNGTAKRSGRSTTVYLLPGLTGRQRKAAIRRMRQEASRGCGPALPGADLTVALAADRCRVGFRNTTAVIRQHPAASLLPTALAALLMALFVLASVSARMTSAPSSVPPVLIPGGGPVRIVGAPTLARMVPLADDNSGGRKDGARVQPAPPGALAASSSGSRLARNATRRGAGDSSRKNKVCGPPQDRASSAERAPGTGQDTGCKRAPLLPPPPPPGGWPQFWPIEHSAP